MMGGSILVHADSSESRTAVLSYDE